MDQVFGGHGQVQICMDQSQEVHYGAKIEDFALVTLGIPKIEELRDQGLGHVFVFTDLLFIHREHISVFTSGRAG